MTITNPILKGFNPDPSIVRVGDDYYIATSTFEWFPGVQIFHSRDLANWTLVARPLNRPSQLDMRGDGDGCGIWAPCLTYDDGLFYLVYTDVKRFGRTSVGGTSGASLRDFHNYMVTSPTIEGDWSEPIRLNSSGFDPSLFHDDDGRKYLTNMLWDHRAGRNRFAGIVMQEYSSTEQRLIGERQMIFPGTSLGFTEAPHIYKRDGWYHLITAEGGTFWGHAVTMARSRNLTGPYEVHPENPVLTARHDPTGPLQRAGHADIVETPDGETFMVYLCGRPLPNRGRCVLGRETAIQPMVWGEDGWLRTRDGSGKPELEFPFAVSNTDDLPPRAEFDSENLPSEFQWLRTPYPDEIFSLTARPGHLRLYGRETLGSLFSQSLVARRQEAFCYTASCAMDFEPRHFQQSAGLICYYNSTKFHYLFVSRDEENGRLLQVMSAVPDQPQTDSFTRPVSIPDGRIELRATVDHTILKFAYWVEGADSDWVVLPETFDATVVSDEATLPGLANFTGAFVGMACQDMAGTGLHADFDWFDYRE